LVQRTGSLQGGHKAWGGHKKTAELLIAEGADVNVKNFVGAETPLHWAAMFGHKEIAELLISKGANVNAKKRHEWTPLHDADTKEIAKLLIAAGADVNAKTEEGLTPLHLAAIKEIGELLIASGADVNAKNVSGWTPLDSAEGELADLLRKHGGKTGAELKAEGK